MTALEQGVAKQALRERMRARRSALDPGWVREASQALAREVLDLPELLEARTVAAFLALPAEPHLDALIARLRGQGMTMCVPAYDRDAKRYRLCRLGEEAVCSGRFGVREPGHPQWVDRDLPDIWLVPGVAFDRAGHRLGHGGGHYDQMLDGTQGTRAGIGFAFQVLDEIAAEAHDIDMHLVITEQGIHRT